MSKGRDDHPNVLLILADDLGCYVPYTAPRFPVACRPGRVDRPRR
ncbi:hypothetical protein ACQP1W_22175 [Spirillospora sp. CA-255316]